MIVAQLLVQVHLFESIAACSSIANLLFSSTSAAPVPSPVPSYPTNPINLATPNLLEEFVEYFQLRNPDLEGLSPASLSPDPGYDTSPTYEELTTPVTSSPATPVVTMPYKIDGPTYAFCGTFSGKESAARWLRKLDHELSGYKQDGSIPPDKYFDAFNMLLTDEAGDWADSYPEAVRLLNTEEPTKVTVETFKALLCERFPSKAAELSPVPFDVELAELRQKVDESLANYYKRTLNLITRHGGRDRPANTTLGNWEAATLDTVLRAFIRGISDLDVRREATKGMSMSERSLKSVYTLAEEARRTNQDIQKMLEEELKADELTFYKTLAERNLSKHKIDALLNSFHTAKAATLSNRTTPFQWSLNSLRFEEQPMQQRSSLSENTAAAQEQHPGTMARPEPPRILNRGNQNNNDNSQRRARPEQELPDRTTSKNPWINGTLSWSFAKDGQLCVKCGMKGHGAKGCDKTPLPSWERAYLRMIVFGDDPQVNFASVGFGQYDGNLQPYRPASPSQESSGTSSINDIRTPSSSSIDSFVAPRANSIRVSTAGLEHEYQLEAKAAEANYGEGSGPNKRPHVEEPQPPQPPQQAQQAQQVPQQQSQQPYQFQAADGRTKRKGQKKTGKRTEPQPLVGMFNDALGKYDSPVSIREVLQKNKVDITWMELVAWSPQVCRELKRLCTRVPKKKTKPKGAEPPNPFAQFNPQLMQQFPQQVPQQYPAQPQQQYPAAPQQQMPQQYPTQPQQVPQAPQPAVQMPQPTMQPPMPPNVTGQVTTNLISNATVAEAEKHTRDLNGMKNIDKAFRIPATVMKPDGTTFQLEKAYVQADQGSDINVISHGLVRLLKLDLRPLSEIGFKGLSMRTADHRDTVLHYYVWLRLSVEGVQRDIRCFVAPEVVTYTPKGETEYLSLILGIPWLWMVDAQISIRGSKILVGDVSAGETPRAVQGPELVFCKWHNLLMYPKEVVAPTDRFERFEEVDASDEEEDDDDDEEDDVSDAEEPGQDFQ